MGFHLTTDGEGALRAVSLAIPETLTPGSRLQKRGQRYYSPSLGRWLSRDPIGEDGGLNLYRCVDNNPIGMIDDRGTRVFDGNWDMFLHYFGFAPDSGRLSDAILQRIKRSDHMRDWEKEIELILRKQIKCCASGTENIRHSDPRESLDDVIPSGFRLFGASSAGGWHVKSVADCSWRCGDSSAEGLCDGSAKCSMKVSIDKYYTFNRPPVGNSANDRWIIRLLNSLAKLNNWGQDPSFNVNGDMDVEWEWHGKK